MTASFGVSVDLPVAGDCNGDGRDEISVFRPGTGIWYLDANGDRIWSSGDLTASFGVSVDKPAIGYWS